MKKLFALALAVVMLTITAYAANTDAPAPADYEKVTIYWNELDDPLDLDALGIDPARTMIKFRSGGMGQKPMAGGYVSSGLVTTSLCRGDLTLDFWVEEEVVGFFKVNEKPKGEEIDKLFPSDANKKYYFFEFSTLDDDDNIIPVEEFTFHRPATLYVHTAGKNSYIYELKDGRLSNAGHYFEEDDSWVIETKTLGNYIVSDKPLTLGNPAADSEPAEEKNSESESNRDALDAAMDKILKIEARPYQSDPLYFPVVHSPSAEVISRLPNDFVTADTLFVPVKLYGLNASLSVDAMEILAAGEIGLNVNLDNGAAEVLIPASFTMPTGTGVLGYSLGHQKDPLYTNLMTDAVNEEDAKTEVHKLGGGTLPTPAALTIKAKLTGTVNVYRWDEDTRRSTFVATTTADGGKVTFAASQLGNFIITTGTIG